MPFTPLEEYRAQQLRTSKSTTGFVPNTPSPTTASSSPVAAVASKWSNEPGLFSRIASDIKKRALNIWDVTSHKQGGVADILDVGGQVAGGIGDVIGQGLTSAMHASPLSSEKDLEVTKQVAQEAFDKLIDLPLPGDPRGTTVRNAIENYDKFKEENPDAARHVEAIANIASLLPIERIPALAGKAFETLGKPGAKFLKRV